MSDRRWTATAVVLLVVGVGCLGAGLLTRSAAEDGPPGARSASSSPASGTPTAPGSSSPRSVPAASTGPPEVTSEPVALRIPAVGVDVPLARLGLNPDRTVEVPADFAQAGWFRLGPTPGRVGSAVILGHVDSYRGPAVFFRLRELRAGDRVEVTLADGAVARFAVRSVETHLKADFPARRVYGSHGDRELQLVTCGGDFDRGARSYLSNVVAYTRLVSVTPAPATGAETVRRGS